MLTRRNRWIVGSFLAIFMLYTGSFAVLSRLNTFKTHRGGVTIWTFCNTEQDLGRCVILIRSASPETETWLARFYRPLIVADACVFNRQHMAGTMSM